MHIDTSAGGFLVQCLLFSGILLEVTLSNVTCFAPPADPNVHSHSEHGVKKQRPNILMIIADDMRPQFGAMAGPYFPSTVHAEMYTPNLDRLAKRSALFQRAYVQFPLCGPSRGSFLSGRRPDGNHQYGFAPYRVFGYNFTTLPQYFKENGYKTYGIGKVFHRTIFHKDENMPWKDESEISFSEQNFWPDEFWNKELDISWLPVGDKARLLTASPKLPDEESADKAIEKLREVAASARLGHENFFLSVGFHKPHVPYICPKKYFDLYPLNSVKLPSNPYLPDNFPTVAWFDYLDLRRRHDLVSAGITGKFNTSMPDLTTRQLRRAYYACISYVDELIGDLIDELESLALEDNTIVVFMSDHGYNLGENMEWTKEMLWDLATHTPLMISIPGLTDKGSRRDELVEHVDLFPTLVDAAGLPELELCPEEGFEDVLACREGSSLMPLIRNEDHIIWKDRVFTQTSRPPESITTVMGHSMTTKRYRYTEWVGTTRHGQDNLEFHWDDIKGVELYDHTVDPEENINMVDDPGYMDVVKELKAQLRAGWREALPQEVTVTYV